MREQVEMGSEMRIGFRMVDGLQIRFAENGSAGSRCLVLTSPWPESLLAFERVWPRLSGTARLIAIDLPGFGRSERRADLLSPVAMSEFLVGLLDEWEIERPHLLGPNVGTAAALFVAANHPGRVKSLIVGGCAFPFVVPVALQELIEASDIDVLGSLDPRGLIPDAMVVEGSDALARDVAGDYAEANAGGRFAEAARYVRSYPEQLRLLAGLFPQIFTPVQIITGRRDPLVPPTNAAELHSQLPNSRIDVLDTGHFVWEEAPDQYAAIITAWVTGGYLTGTGFRQA